MLEGPTAIIALCAPSINQLIVRTGKHRSLTSLFTSRKKISMSRSESSNEIGRSNGFSQLDNSADGTLSRNTYANSSDQSSIAALAERDRDDDSWAHDLPLGQIAVRHDYSVSSRRQDGPDEV